jgi:spore coat polysaccharide biosynthesis protein SpsF
MRGTAVLLQARMGSSRLPGKSMRMLAGHTMLAHAIVRLQASGYPVALVTTTRSEDDCLVEAACHLRAEVFRGSDVDVLDRFAKAVQHFELHRVVRATADNPAVDIDAVSRMLSLLDRASADHVVEYGLPVGGAVEALRGSALLRAAAEATDPYDREHVTPLIKRNSEYRALAALAPGHVRRRGLRLTVDTEEDLAAMQRLFDAVGLQHFPAPLSVILDVMDRMLDRSDGSGSGRREIR